jgi:predicted RNase H-like HicB family nuclease
MPQVIEVTALWDGEASVWVAESEQVPGLITEAATMEALMAKLQVLIPELLDANGYPDGEEVPFRVRSERTAVAHRHHA